MSLVRALRNRAPAVAALVAMAAAVCLTAAWGPAGAQEQRTIKLFIPFQAGGGSDILGRFLADLIGRTHGPTFIVENRPGAGTAIATEAAARAEPDGNTLLIVGNSFIINPLLRKRNYDSLTSFEPLCLLTRSPNVVAVHRSSPHGTLKDLVNAANAKPGEVTMAINGPFTSQQMAFEKLKRSTKIDMIAVTFSGGAPSVNALLGQHVAALVVNYPSAGEVIAAGNLRTLAITALKRNPLLPDIPTVGELGYPEIDEDVWFGIVAPAKTPAPVVAQLAAWFGAAVKAPELGPKLNKLGYSVVGTCGQDFASFLKSQHEDYDRIIREANIKGK
jgi:tripartite-type tricarboxylate transporter receptor subunit TctC